MNNIVAVVGMCGAGKSVVCEYFERLNYKNVYFGGVTMDKLKEQNLEITPENEKMMREGLRKELGMGAYAIVLLPKIRSLVSEYDVVLDGLYSWDELKILKEEFGDRIKVIAIVADKALRYERLAQRPVRPFNYDDAKKRDIAEIENSDKGGPIAYADYFILNNGSVDEIDSRLDDIVRTLKK